MQAKEVSNDITSESTGPNEFSKSVTKVQSLCHLGVWSQQAVLKELVQCFFSKRTALLHRKKALTPRKRVVVLTPDAVLLVYETNCTGYSFDVKAAGKMKTLCMPPGRFEKSCTVTLKYPFGAVNLVLVNEQVGVWRRTLSAIFEGEPIDTSLRSHISLYTAKDDDVSYDYYGDYSDPVSQFDYTDQAISLRSVPGCIDVSVTSPAKTFTISEGNQYSNLTAISAHPSTVSLCSSVAPQSPPKPPNQETISIRQGSRAVSYLARKFEERLSRRQKGQGAVEPESSSTLEVLFPPIQKIYKAKELEEGEADETLKPELIVVE